MARQQTLVCLWARNDDYPTPQFLCAVSGGLWDSMPEEAEERFSEAKEWFDSFGEGTWTYWNTTERVPEPVPALSEEQS